MALGAPCLGAPLLVYDDQLRNGVVDWSWAARNLAQTAVVHSGTAAISFEPDSWQALYLHRDAGIDPALYDAVELWIRGGGAGGQSLTIALISGGTNVGSGSLAPFVDGGTIPAGSWAKVRVPFSALGVTVACDGFWLQDATGGNQAAVYVDDVVLTENSTPPPPLTVQVYPDLDRRPIDPRIYGVNWGSTAQAMAMHWPVRRWGGNTTTRYNWQSNRDNRGSDWFFYVPPAGPGNGGDSFIDETRAAGGEPLMTVPTIGWTVGDFPASQARWSFSVAKYGAQQETECTRTNNASWCHADAGNGVRPNGVRITGNDPHDTSKEIGPSFITAWMAHIAARTGSAASGGVRLFALDNESALWHETHRDVHPAGVTYDELWQRTRDYAAAMKAQDPAAQIFGPVTWGWCDVYFSGADSCSPGADYQAHGSVPLLQWYLMRLREYELANGVRLVDWIDLHYYPQSPGVALSDDESEGTAARRLRSIKSLYDATYRDESWITNAGYGPIQLLPTVRGWRDAHLPGARLAITEYQWGNDDGLSSALAQAEVLAVFGREGVDLATRWVSPEASSLVEDAFRLYLSYDGAGARVSGDSVRARSSDVDRLGAYAVRGTGPTAGKLYVLLFNKHTVPLTVPVSFPAGTLAGSLGTLYRFDGPGPGQRLRNAGTVGPVGDGITLDLPARSATLAVLTMAPAGPPPPATSFFTLTPCRLVDTRNPDVAGQTPIGGPALSDGVTRSFDLAGRCGLPATAKAVSVNITATGAGRTGYLTVWPASAALPGTSTVSFAAGQTRATNAILGVSTDGYAALAIRAVLASPGTTHVIVDVNGYFE